MINKINNTTNETAFKANFRLTRPVKDQTRLANIQKLFSERTQEFKDTVSLENNPECSEELFFLGENIEQSFVASCKNKFETMLETLTDSEIADKLVKVLKGLKALNKREVSISALEENLHKYQFGKRRNQFVADNSRAKGDEIMAKRFEYLANCFAKKVQKIENDSQKINNTYFASIDKIAQGDEDILNFKNC